LNFGLGKRIIILVLLTIVIVTTMFGRDEMISSATQSYAYVSNLNGSKVFVVDLSTKSIIKTITVYTPTGTGFPYMNDLKIFM